MMAVGGEQNPASTSGTGGSPSVLCRLLQSLSLHTEAADNKL